MPTAEIIAIRVAGEKIGHGTVQAVCARELYSALHSQQQFTDLACSQHARGQFVEGRDDLTHSFVTQLPSYAKHATDYLLTLDCAKRIALMAGGELGFTNPKGERRTYTRTLATGNGLTYLQRIFAERKVA